MRIIDQLIDAIPGGPIDARRCEATKPCKAEVYGSIEGSSSTSN